MSEATKKWLRSQIMFYLVRWNASEKAKEEQVESFINCLESMLKAEKIVKETKELVFQRKEV